MSVNWVEYIKRDENKALTEIYSTMRQPFVNWILSNNSCNPEEAVDIFQVSVVILYENVITGKVDQLSNLKSYLFSIGRNKLMEHFRNLKKHNHSQLDNNVLLKQLFVDEYDLDSHQIDHIELMHQALEELGDPCKSLLQSYYFKKMNLLEIADALSYKNSDTVKTKKFKCIKRLRKIFTAILENTAKSK